MLGLIYSLHLATVLMSGRVKLQEKLGPGKDCTGTGVPLTVHIIYNCFSTFVRPRSGKLFFPKDEGSVPTDLLVNIFPIFFNFIH